MKKWLALALVVAVLAVAALPVLAKDSQAQLVQLEELYQQLAAIKKKIIDVRVSMGQITPEQGNIIKERADEHHNWMKENNYQCPGYGFHNGKMRRGHGAGPRFLQ